jgi:hypothetical protein
MVGNGGVRARGMRKVGEAWFSVLNRPLVQRSVPQRWRASPSAGLTAAQDRLRQAQDERMGAVQTSVSVPDPIADLEARAHSPSMKRFASRSVLPLVMAISAASLWWQGDRTQAIVVLLPAIMLFGLFALSASEEE